jgi:hypothetical protein
LPSCRQFQVPIVVVVRAVLVLLVSTLVLAGCGAAAPAGSDDPQELARDYVSAINARDGARVCALMTKDAAAELREGDLSCDRTVAGYIGYVEDAGAPRFLRYRLRGVRSGSTRGDYSSIDLSLESRRRSTDGRQAFERCSFEDIVWITHDGAELRIAKPSLALYVAFGATLHEGVLAPPGVAATSGEERQLDCKPEKGVRPDSDAPVQSLAGLAALLARESSGASEVRCFEGNGGDGWDVICTYFDATMGERMKLGFRVGPGAAITGSGSVPEETPLPAA